MLTISDEGGVWQNADWCLQGGTGSYQVLTKSNCSHVIVGPDTLKFSFDIICEQPITHVTEQWNRAGEKNYIFLSFNKIHKISFTQKRLFC